MAERRIRTEFDANTASFERGVRRMNDQMRRFQRGTESRLDRIDNRFRRSARVVGHLRNAFIALGAVAGLRQLTRNVEQAVNQLDNIAKAADRLGLTTDALQELRVAAELSGVSVQQFDLAFQRFVRRAGEAANNTGEAQDALETLGITMQELQTLSPEELFLRVAEAMGNTDDAAERLRLGFKLFDSEGVRVVEMLRNGTEGLEQMRERARELGLVFESDLIRRTVEMRDELTLIQRQLNVDVTEAMVNLGPVIRDLGDLLVWLADRAAQAREGFARLFSGRLIQSIGDLGLREELDAARAELAGLNEDLERALDPATRSPEMQVQLNFAQNRASIEGRPFDEANFILEQFAERRTELVDRVDELQARLGQILSGEGAEDLAPPEPSAAPPAPTRGTGGSGAAQEASEDRESFLERELRLLAERTAVLRAQAAAQASLNPELENYDTRVRAATIAAELLVQAEREGVEVTPELRQQVEQLALRYAEADEAARGLSDGQNGLTDSVTRFERVGENAMRGFVRDIRSGIPAVDALNNALSRISDRLLEIALNNAFNPQGGSAGGGIFSSLFSFIPGLFGGGGASFPTSLGGFNASALTFHRGGVVGQTAAPLRTVPAHIFNDAPRLHDGLGPREFPAILERGEIVVPKNIGGARAGANISLGDTVLNVTEPGASPDELRRILAEHRKETVRQIVEMNEKDPTVLHT